MAIFQLLDRLLRFSRSSFLGKRDEKSHDSQDPRVFYAGKAVEDFVYDYRIETGEVFWGKGLYENLKPENRNQSVGFSYWESQIHPDDRTRVISSIGKAIRNKKDHWREEYRFRKSNNSYGYFIDSAFLVKNNLGEAVRMVGIMQEVKSLLDVDQESVVQEKRFKTILEKGCDIIIVCDKQGKIKYISPNIREKYGIDPEKNTGASIFDFLFEKDIEMAKMQFSMKKNSGGLIGPLRVRIPNKSFIWVENYLIPYYAEGEDDILINSRDISERIKYLKEKERLFIQLQQIGETIPGGIFQIKHTKEGLDFSFLSEGFKKDFDIDPTDSFRSFLSLIHSSDLTKFTEAAKNSINNLSPLTENIRFKKEDSFRVFQIKAYPVTVSGEILLNGTFIDVSELEQLNVQLMVFKRAVESVGQGVVITDPDLPDNPIVYVNEEFVKQTGYTKEEVIGKNPRFMQGPGSDKKIIEKIKTHIRLQQNFQEEIINYRKDGKPFWNLMNITPVKDLNGNLTHYIGILSDITGRKNFEDALEVSNERFNLAVKATHDAIWDWDIQNDSVTWHITGETPFAMTFSGDSKNEHWLARICHSDKQRVEKKLADALKNRQEFWQEEFKLNCFGEESIAVLNRAFTIYTPTGVPKRMIGAMTDVTERKKILEEQINLVAELENSNRNLRQFTYIVSHNLRSSIANILGLSSIINTDDPAISEENKIVLENISKSALTLDTTIKDLNEILKIKLGLPDKAEEVLFDRVLEEVTELLSEQISNAQAQIQTDFSQAPGINSIKTYISSIFYNLLSNAIKFRAKNRSLIIKICSERKGRLTCISFEDNGIGMNLEKHGNKIFGLYKRFRKEVEGKGIGLYLVKTQAESLGGTAEVFSKEGEGTKFKICLKNL